MSEPKLKQVVWEGSAKRDWAGFPAEVQDDLGYALHLVQSGERVIPGAKPLSGGKLQGLGIVELIDDHDTDTYRAIYTTKIGEVIYVLHAFKKKSTKGIATPKADIDLIYERYQAALSHHTQTASASRKKKPKR
jgi:phage-related protein